MATITVMVCTNDKCDYCTEDTSVTKCPKCGSKLEAQMTLALKK